MRILLMGATFGVVACNVGDGNTSGNFGSTSAGADEGDGGPGTSGTLDGSGSSTADSSGAQAPKFDVPPSDAPFHDRPASCVVRGGASDAVVPCRHRAPPDSFTPWVQWSWEGYEDDTQVVTLPLVANLTDDDENGTIDLCDTPDIVVQAYDYCDAGQCLGVVSRLYVLDGATGAMHYQAPVETISGEGRSPALGDIDGDGLVEIVAPTPSGIVVFEHDGTVKWQASGQAQGPLAIADLDADGSPEIYASTRVWNADGETLFTYPQTSLTPVAVDLDGDSDLEIVTGPAAYHHDGSIYYQRPELGYVFAGGPAPVDIDGDGQPEIVVVGQGISILEHDGTPIVLNWPNADDDWARPQAIHDMDGDGTPELAAGSGHHYNVLSLDPLDLMWSANVLDASSAAAGTAFDFLGDGEAEAMYADETDLFIYDENGGVLLQADRTSWTDLEMPIVADVDNDGSAEIVVVSNRGYTDGDDPPVQVIGDAEGRWVQARRIWNQHAYHVTNVREDGTIPQFQEPNWATLNTFRTQSQIEAGMVCQPPAG